MSTSTALIVGASRGLGLAIATDLARRGFRVVISSRSQESLETAASVIRQRVGGADVIIAPGDVTKPEDVARVVAAAEEAGPVDAAIMVAGIIQVGPWQATRREHFEQAIDTMVWGPINVALELVPRMTARGRGRIGFISSVGGRVSMPRMVPYSVAKFATAGLAEGLAAELAGTGVTATGVYPGIMRTGSHGAATFYGDAGKQYAWFAPTASLPVLTIDAERAAAQIVDGVLAGKPVVHVTWSSHLASRLHGLAPSMTVRALGVASRVLPKGSDPTIVPGTRARRGKNRVLRVFTALADGAADRFNGKV